MIRKGRFKGKMDFEASKYTSSIEEDKRLLNAVVQINAAHAHMLMECNIIDESGGKEILRALLNLRETGIGALDLRHEVEDIHLAVEEYVREEVGEEVGAKIHTAKSRNDQVSTAIRMVLRKEVLKVQEELVSLIKVLVERAREHVSTIMPGYTHLQVAEPTTLAHYFNSYSQAFIRDLEKFDEVYRQTNFCPMGGCAMTGTSFSIDRNMISELLGFEGIVENTIDAVSSREFALQLLSVAAIMMSNLGRLAEEIVLWSTAEFDMIEIPDEFASTSSIMPQKKNPVVAEIARAKVGRVAGNLMGGLNIMKSIPKSYNLDLQELTPLVWNSVEQSKDTLRVLKKFIKKIKPNLEKMRKFAEKGYSTATELADTIVRETEIPFRKAHEIVGELVSQSLEVGKGLNELELDDLQAASEKACGVKIKITEKKFREALDLERCVKLRDLPGGPAPKSVEDEVKGLEKKIEEHIGIIEKRKNALAEARDNLLSIKE